MVLKPWKREKDYFCSSKKVATYERRINQNITENSDTESAQSSSNGTVAYKDNVISRLDEVEGEDVDISSSQPWEDQSATSSSCHNGIFYDEIGLLFNKDAQVLALFSTVFWVVLLMQPINAIST